MSTGGRLEFLRTWLLPPGFHRYLDMASLRGWFRYRRRQNLYIANRALKAMHAGQRCFILANGPSVKEQDIRALQGEIVISVSSGYHHPDFASIAPRYHCVPALTYHSGFTQERAIAWFQEMHAHLGSAKLVLSDQERCLVERFRLFEGREIYYLCMSARFDAMNDIPDLAACVPRVSTVPVMALMLAMYMGCNEIYLIGTDHDWFIKKEYKYFYEPTVLKGSDPGTDGNGLIKTGLFDELPNITAVWSQYRALRELAEKVGVQIFNATNGGLLDEFPRVELRRVLARGSAAIASCEEARY